jgi:AbrB family looped-hinge helix DNA binding protein
MELIMEATIDRFGRIVIPKKIRDDFNLKPGSQIHFEEAEKTIVMKPVYNEPNLIEKDGVLVFSGTSAGNIEKALSEHREERMKPFGGEKIEDSV